MRKIGKYYETPYEGYFVSRDGEVVSFRVPASKSNPDKRVDFGKAPKKLSYKTDKDGYFEVLFSINRKRICKKVHQVVAETFLAPKPIGDYCVDHINRNRQDSRVENLRWRTRSENSDGMRGKKPWVAKNCVYDRVLYHSIKDACTKAEITTSYFHKHPEIKRSVLIKGVETIEIVVESRVGGKLLPVEVHPAEKTQSRYSPKKMGFTIPEIDKTLLPYCKKTYDRQYDFYKNVLHLCEEKADSCALLDVERELEQGFQSLELKLNTVPSSRGDFAFTTLTFGQWDYKNISKEDAYFMHVIGSKILEIRKKGHGKNHKPVVFPKLVFLYDKDQIENDLWSYVLFEEAVQTSAECMYPDYLSLTDDYSVVARMYKEHGVITSPMGCRAYLSPWWNEDGKAVTIGRCNIGAVSLNIPLIITIAKQLHPDNWQNEFWNLLDDRMEVIRNFLKKRYDIIRHQKCSSNPLAFTQGGFYEGFKDPDDEVGDLVRYMTASFGITALDEATYLWTGKRLIEDESGFSTKVLRHIQKKIAEFKKEDGYLYAMYGTPAESLCATQAKQYAKYCKEAEIENVFEHAEHYSPEYFTNSFHLNVTEDITPFEKQDKEFRDFHIVTGGRIQYVRLDNPENHEAVKKMIERGMEKGFYQGVNFDSAYCNDCGKHSTNVLFECPHCGSKNISVISRVCGYLGYSNVNGKSRMNDGKMTEIQNRKSM